MKKTLNILLLTMLMLTGCDSDTTDDGKIKVPLSSVLYEEANYQEVIDDFESAGFTNVQTVIIDDLITGWTTKDGEVESVTVNGDAEFSGDDRHDPSVEVVVTYHTFPQDDNSEEDEVIEDDDVDELEEPSVEADDGLLTPPYITIDDFKGVDYRVVEQAFKDAGFENVETSLEHMSVKQESNRTVAVGETSSIMIDNKYTYSSTYDATMTYPSDILVEIDFYVPAFYEPLRDGSVEDILPPL